MRRIVRSICSRGLISAITNISKSLLHSHARVLAVMLVIALLVTSLPASAGTTGNHHAGSATRYQRSLASQFYNDLSTTLASIKAWVDGYVRSHSAVESIPYKPVAAYFNPAPPFITQPMGLTVTSVSGTAISLSWTPPAGGADHYQIERSESVSGPFFFVANASGATYNDTSVTNLHAYLYRVRAVSSIGAISTPSNMALGTAISFEFQVLANQFIKAQHYHDVRTAINLVRAVGGLPGYAWARGNLAALDIKKTDIDELRTALDAALNALSIPVTAYDDPTLTAGVTLIKATHLEQLQLRSTRGKSNSSGPMDPDSSSARLDPMNETGGGGENPLSRNFNWNLPLVNLPGRAGLNLGLTLSYNSLVWTKIGATAISFDRDNGFPGPGFRLGFPVIQPLYYNAEVGKNAFLLIGSDGSHSELRQVGASALYESADSSHMLLESNTMSLSLTDGTQLTYELRGGEYKCAKIKDRNGNYISVSYNAAGRVNTITDTVGRVLTFNYDANGWLTSITQLWNQTSTAVTHYWARFEYADKQIDTNFPGLTVFGPADGTNLKILSRIKLADDSYFDFSYTSWGQVYKISSYAPDAHLLNYRFYNLPQTAGSGFEHSDCPRFTQRRDWAQYWNGDTDDTTSSSEEALTTFAVPVSDTWTMPNNASASGVRAQVTAPDGTSNKIYFISSPGWQRGLTALVDTYASGNSTPVRRSMTTWTQDNTTVSYPLNPRVTATNIYDDAGNRARTDITYQQFAFTNGTSCQLPQDVYEYANDEIPPNPPTMLRSTRITYNMTATYTDRHIFGLASFKHLYDGNVNTTGVLKSKVGFLYDESLSIDGTNAPIQHDDQNYGPSLLAGRANLTSIKRYDVTNSDVITTTKLKYNRAGSVISSKDALDHEVTINYTDSFSDGVNTRSTFAYGTTGTDAGGYSSTSKYNFDFGAITYKRTPQPNVTTNTPGPEQTSAFDSIGRLQQVTSLVNNAYTRFEYPNSQIRVDTYTTIQENEGEAHSFRITDGVGRVVAAATDHPGSVGGFSGQKFVYDAMGRVIKTSNPTETNASGTPSQWTTAGDDTSAGWIYSQQTYDWKGRPRVTTNPSMTSNSSETTTKEISYSGCGCAGGEVVTITDEGVIDATGALKKRQQKIYADVLGRTVKTEVLNWDGAGLNGTGGTVYAATTLTYNARDQLTLERRFAGPTSSITYQDMTMSYDGFARLKTRHLPQQQVDVNNSASTDHTTWNYNNDDTAQSVVDARGIITTFTYNARQLSTGIAFNSSNIPSGSNVAPTTSIAFAYDAVGNRTTMSDASGAVNYHYDQLSRMDWEERSFAELPNAGVFRLTYEYNLGGILKKITDQRSSTSFTETLDKLGRVTTVNAVGAAGVQSQFVSNTQYRAWGGLKSRAQPGFTVNLTYNSRLLPNSYTMDGDLPAQMAYEYHNDGSIRYANDQSGQFFDVVDRAYSYDAAGRLQHAYSGLEARNFVNNTTGGTPDGPYAHDYLYDHWGNLLQDSGRLWSRTIHTFDNYDVNNRVPEWSYDAEGNVLSRNEVATTISPFVPARYTYDAAGRQVGSTQTRTYTLEYGNETSVFVNSQTFDGDNQITHYALVRNTTLSNHQLPPGSQTTAEAYLLRSTVLAGSVISEYKGDGTWSKTHVYAGDERLGQQTTAPSGTPQSILENLDPITGDGIKHQDGGYFGMTTLDVTGSDVGVSDPFPPDGSGAENGGVGELIKTVPFITPIEGGGAKCILDGLEIECSRISGNSSVQCPNNDCNATVTLVGRSNGRVVATWVVPAPEGWDPSYDGTYVFNDGLPWRRRGGNPAGGQVYNHARLRSPQNSGRQIVPLGNLQKGLEALLKTGDCAAFVQKLIDKANERYGGGWPHATSFWDAFSRIQDAGGYELKDVTNGGTVRGDLFFGEFTNPSLPEISTAGPGTVHITPFGPVGRAATPAEAASAQARYVFTAFHETLHLAKRGWYNDRELARAGHAVDRTTAPNYKEDAYLSWSGNLDTLLQKHCAHPVK